ncbi:hypothetical protein PIROE2DRAFT_3449 [Piromyces sp. E2]|nr:hypothetical protein PIROE2DRAFT_3449 [Piromyces sp. E2]|eukprot:OUM68762.1 hypothetical protein PIROE2DRAFT_3449 [Piromyces sp. E2]
MKKNTYLINKSQYFNPLFSWVVVTFTYFSIGIQGGAIWKYLFYTSSAGFVATCCGMIYGVSNRLIVEENIFTLLTWVEGMFWTLSEWGYVYINYVKIRTCISELRKTRWKVIMGGILIYSIAIRVRLMHLDFSKRINDSIKNRGTEFDVNKYNKEKDYAHGFLYLPLGVVCALFIYYIINEFLSEKDDSTQNVLSILLHSTLTRMRNLGLIFLVDILLLRIDLDNNQIAMQDKEIEELQKKKDLGDIISFSDTISPLSPKSMSSGLISPGIVRPGSISPGIVSPRSVSPGIVRPGLISPGIVSPTIMNDYAKAILSENNNYKEIEEQPIKPIGLKPNPIPSTRGSIYTSPSPSPSPSHSPSHSSTTNPHTSIQSSSHLIHSNKTGISRTSQLMRNSTSTENSNSHFIPSSPPPEKPMKSEKRKNNIPMHIAKPPESLSINVNRQKYNQTNIYPNENTIVNVDRRQSSQSVLLGKKVYAKVPLESSSTITSTRTVVSPSSTYSTSKHSSISPSMSDTVALTQQTSPPPPLSSSIKKNPGNILIESNLIEDSSPSHFESFTQ